MADIIAFPKPRSTTRQLVGFEVLVDDQDRGQFFWNGKLLSDENMVRVVRAITDVLAERAVR